MKEQLCAVGAEPIHAVRHPRLDEPGGYIPVEDVIRKLAGGADDPASNRCGLEPVLVHDVGADSLAVGQGITLLSEPGELPLRFRVTLDAGTGGDLVDLFFRAGQEPRTYVGSGGQDLLKRLLIGVDVEAKLLTLIEVGF